MKGVCGKKKEEVAFAAGEEDTTGVCVKAGSS